jgi:8-oxo-dGTP diphosphatase
MRFNVRVYGILIQDEKVLVSDEYIQGHNITKFPGGGLEYGEGTIDCLIREFKEEMNVNIRIKSHFYTTDFFVKSAFDSSQVVSIYYLVETTEKSNFPTHQVAFDYESTAGSQALRWVQLKEISNANFTLIIDKKVGDMLSQLG